MPSDEGNTPEIEVVGPPILTVYFKNKRDAEDKPVAGQQEVADFSCTGGFLIAQTLEGELMVFPGAELEYATITPQLSIKEGEDGEEASADADSEDAASANAEADFESEGGVVLPFKPDFAGGSGDSTDGDSSS